MQNSPRIGYCLIGFIVCFAVVFVSKSFGNDYAWAYNYPFVILEAVSLFLLLSQISLKTKRINALASTAFGVYLIHTSMFFNKVGYETIFHASQRLDDGPIALFFSVVLSAIFFYALGHILESLKRRVFLYTVVPVLNKMPLINNRIEI